MGDFPDTQEAIRIAIAGCTFALTLGLAIASGTWAGYALAAMMIPIAWVMIPDGERVGLPTTSEPGRTMAPKENNREPSAPESDRR